MNNKRPLTRALIVIEEATGTRSSAIPTAETDAPTIKTFYSSVIIRELSQYQSLWICLTHTFPVNCWGLLYCLECHTLSSNLSANSFNPRMSGIQGQSLCELEARSTASNSSVHQSTRNRERPSMSSAFLRVSVHVFDPGSLRTRSTRVEYEVICLYSSSSLLSLFEVAYCRMWLRTWEMLASQGWKYVKYMRALLREKLKK